MKSRLLLMLLVISDRLEFYGLSIRPYGKRVPNMLNDPIGTHGDWNWLYTLQDMG